MNMTEPGGGVADGSAPNMRHGAPVAEPTIADGRGRAPLRARLQRALLHGLLALLVLGAAVAAVVNAVSA